MAYPHKIDTGLKNFRAAREQGDAESQEKAMFQLIVDLDALDDADFAHDDDATSFFRLADEAHAGLSEDDSEVIMTIDHEDFVTIIRDDQSTRRVGWSSLLAAYLAASIVMDMVNHDKGTDENEWLVALPVQILDLSEGIDPASH